MNKLDILLQGYQRDLFAAAGIEVATRVVIEPGTILMAVEEMLGVECGGENLGAALEEWLSLPPGKRRPMRFADLQNTWDMEGREVNQIVANDLRTRSKPGK